MPAVRGLAGQRVAVPRAIEPGAPADQFLNPGRAFLDEHLHSFRPAQPFPRAQGVVAVQCDIVLLGGDRHTALRVDGTAFGRTALRQHEDTAGPAQPDGRPQSVDHDSVDGEVEGDPVIDGEVALNLLLQLAEAVERHEQAVKGARVLTRICLPDPFHRGVDLPDTGRIVRVNVTGFGAGHRHQPDQTKDGPAGERLRAAYDPRDHAGIIHPSDMPYS